MTNVFSIFDARRNKIYKRWLEHYRAEDNDYLLDVMASFDVAGLEGDDPKSLLASSWRRRALAEVIEERGLTRQENIDWLMR